MIIMMWICLIYAQNDRTAEQTKQRNILGSLGQGWHSISQGKGLNVTTKILSFHIRYRAKGHLMTSSGTEIPYL